MSKTLFIGDLHLGHRSILGFAGNYRDGTTTEEHDAILVKKWNSVVGVQDLVYVLGDVAFTEEALHINLPQMNGRKILVRGNHDVLPLKEYLRYFEDIQGFVKYKKYWLSHAPIHPTELRGRRNIHGHIHMNTIPDEDYINVCVEMVEGFPQTLEQLLKGEKNASKQ